MIFHARFLMVFAALWCLAIMPAHAQEETTPEEPVNIEAQSFYYDQNASKITAKGQVEIIQAGRVLHADEVIYDINDDFAYAQGNVALYEPTGDVHHAEILELNDKMRRGLAKSLFTELQDGSRLWATKAVRKSPEEHVLENAEYTPCKACEENPEKTPTWSMKADEVIHDKDSATMSYRNARLEAFGVPVLYTPYFTHPDGTVRQKSGFLTPDFGFGSDYGFNTQMPYYWAISPDMDLTTGIRFFTEENPQLNLEMRKRFKDASLKVQTSATSSSRTDSVSGTEVTKDGEFRGHLFADGLWAIDPNWRAGMELALTTDEQYLEQYDITSEDTLENRVYVERFDDRDYASVEVLGFQDLRVNENIDQPNALPLAQMSFLGDPNAVLGGRYRWNTSFLSLFREGEDQDVNRLSSTLSWQKQNIFPVGLTSLIDLSVRGDTYYTMDRDIARIDPTESDTKRDSRLFPTAHVEVAYPMHKNLTTSQIRMKPKISMTARPDIENDSDIPNEDSIDAQLDASNLFEMDRFPGLDRVEDRTHISYGMDLGYYNFNGNSLTGFFGQSYRLEEGDNPFQNGSGLENQISDYVGEVGASFDENKHNLNYRFQLDGETLQSKRHEFYAGTEIKNTNLSAIYLYERGASGTQFTDSREQIAAGMSHRFAENWTVSTSGLYDLSSVNHGLRSSRFGLGYDDDCFGVTAYLDRDLQSESSGATDTTVYVRFFLKNLGEFETTAYSATSGGVE